ncbi:hypothetical protein O181_003252 [Austropuccinia psidii MF-1]|uniref:Uncharacterized protein n=1 Tax=Austropuccinia psidii MF-1 TaxID=1389203 RepID=A0A9Q3BE11_9BASI|nr:hypothetical protein [Austropuccinia psidii MF-1]
MHELLPDCEKLLGHPNTCKLLNGWHPLNEMKNMMVLTAELRKNNPPPPKQVPKPALIAINSNSNMKNQQKGQKKGKGNAQATKPYSQRYWIPGQMCFRWSKPLWNFRERRKTD